MLFNKLPLILIKLLLTYTFLLVSLMCLAGNTNYWNEVAENRYSIQRGNYDEVKARCNSIERKIKPESDSLRYLLLWCHKLQADANRHQFQFNKESKHLSTAELLYNEISDADLKGRAAVALAEYYYQKGLYSKSLSLLPSNSETIESDFTDPALLRCLIKSKLGQVMGLSKKIKALESNYLKDFVEPKGNSFVTDHDDLRLIALENYSKSWILKAEIQSLSGNYKKAIETLDLFLSWLPSQKVDKDLFLREVYLAKARIFEKQGNFKDAAKIYRKAYAIGSFSHLETIQNNTLSSISLNYLKAGYLTQYDSYHRRLEMNIRQSFGKQYYGYFLSTINKISALEIQGYYSAASNQLEDLLKDLKILPENHHLVEELWEIKVRLDKKRGKIKEYLSSTEKLLTIYSDKYGEGTPKTQFLFININHEKLSFTGEAELIIQSVKASIDSVIFAQTDKEDVRRYDAYKALTTIALEEENFGEAVKSAHAAYTLFEKSTSRDEQILYKEEKARYAQTLIANGNYKDGLKITDSIYAQIIKERTGEQKVQRTAFIRLASNYKQCSNFKMAKEAARKAYNFLNKEKEINPIEQATISEELADLYVQTGFHASAEPLLINSLKLKTKVYGDLSLIIVKPLTIFGQLETAKGNFSLAMERLDKAHEIVEKNPGTNSLLKIEIREQYSKLYKQLGESKKQLEAIQQSLKICEESFGKESVKYSILSVESLLAHFNYDGKVDPESESVFQKALDNILSKAGEDSQLYVDLLNKQVNFFYATRQLDKAIGLADRIEEFWTKKLGTGNSYVAEIKVTKGNIYYLQEDYSKALQNYKSSRDIYEKSYGEKHPGYAHATAKMARANYMKGNSEEAIELALEAVEKDQAFTDEYFSFMSFAEKDKYWSSIKTDFEFLNFLAYKFKDEKTKLIEKVYKYNIATKAILLNNTVKVRQRILNSGDSVLVDHYQKYLTQRELMAEYLSLSKQELATSAINLAEEERKLEDMEADLSKRSDNFEKEGKMYEPTWDNVSKSLKEGEYAVEIVRFRHFDKEFFEKTAYYMALIGTAADKAPKVVWMENGSHMEGRNLHYYRNLMKLHLDDTLSYKTYWSPIKENIPDNATVYVSPDGVYNQLNLETLYSPEGQYAMEENNFIQVTNTKNLIQRLENKSKKPQTVPLESFALMGSPSFYPSDSKIEEQSRTISPLPGAEAEVKAVASLAKKHNKKYELLLNADVKEEKVKQLANPTVFHIATHGLFVEKRASQDGLASNPLFNAGLLLHASGDILDSKEESGYNSRDGILTAFEVMNLNFDNTELVILSACETGRGHVKSGEGVYGLQRAFLIAGSHSIIMSLFKVNDEVTRLLMQKFYEKWLITGNRRAAFVYAKNKVRKKFPAPLYWGAFVLVEDKP